MIRTRVNLVRVMPGARMMAFYATNRNILMKNDVFSCLALLLKTFLFSFIWRYNA